MLVLVTGASGTLRPAAASLLARGDEVLALGRSRARLRAALGDAPGLCTVAADWTDPSSLRAALDGVAVPAASLLYLPGAGEADGTLLRRAASGPGVELLTSSHSDPADAGRALARRRAEAPHLIHLLLGWHGDDAGAPTRWHTPEEISTAAVEALDAAARGRSGSDTVTLGELRPWSRRPRG